MKLALITALALPAAAPAFDDVTSAAELNAQHDFATSFVASSDLGKVSPAEIAGNDEVSAEDVYTQQADDYEQLRVTSGDDKAARR